MYQLDSLPRSGPNLPSFWAMCTLALPTVTAWGWAGPALPPPSTALSEQFTWLSPPPQSPENKLSPPHPPGPGRTRLQNAKRSQEGEKLKSGLREGWRLARVPGRLSPSPCHGARPALSKSPRGSKCKAWNPAQPSPRWGGGWVGVCYGIILSAPLSSQKWRLRPPGSGTLARGSHARPDTGAERSSGWGPRRVRLRGAGEAGAPERGGGAAGGAPGDRLRLTLGAPHPALSRALSRLPGLLPGHGEPGGGAPSPYLWW